MGMFTQNEIMLMIGVVSILLVCIIVLTILDIKDYLKLKKGNVEEVFKEEFKESEEPINKVPVYEVADEVVEPDLNNDDVLFEEMEDEKFVIPEASIEEVTLPKKEEVPKKELKVMPSLDEIDEIEKNLPNNKDDITNFEMEQERTAIISLDELLKKSNELYDSNEAFQYDDGNEPISIDEVIQKFNKENNGLEEEATIKQVPEIMQDIVEEKELYSKKETIPFISSVYGIEKKDNALEFENTATYEKLDRENYNDFVSKLREMKENK